MIRVLNAARIREEYRRKRKQGEDSLDCDGRPSKRQKTHVEEKPRGKDGKGALIIKVCCGNLEATANPDQDLFAARGDSGSVQSVRKITPTTFLYCPYLLYR